MLPKRLTKPVTIYSRWQNILTGQVKPMRRVLHRCTWNSVAVSTAISTGQMLRESTVITIFKEVSGLTFIPPHEWLALSETDLESYWTCDLTQEAKPVLVPFISEYDFSFGTNAQVTKEENDFIRKTPGALRAAQFENNAVSGGEMGAHYLVMA